MSWSEFLFTVIYVLFFEKTICAIWNGNRHKVVWMTIFWTVAQPSVLHLIVFVGNKTNINVKQDGKVFVWDEAIKNIVL